MESKLRFAFRWATQPFSFEHSRKAFTNLEHFLFRIYDMDNDGYISNGELFQVKHQELTLFSLKSFLKKQSKAQLFRSSKKNRLKVCTLWSNCQVLKMMVGNNLKDTQLQQVGVKRPTKLQQIFLPFQIVDKTILFHDKDNNGKINFEEFCEVSFFTWLHWY